MVQPFRIHLGGAPNIGAPPIAGKPKPKDYQLRKSQYEGYEGTVKGGHKGLSGSLVSAWSPP